jgi:hypothetical protein
MAAIANLPSVSTEGNLARYLQEIRKFPMLDAETEFMLAKRWTEHEDPEAAQTLVTSHLRLVAKIAMGYRGYGLPLNELISEGNVGRTILSLAAAAALTAACISTTSSDAFARGGARVGVHHARVGVHHGGVAHRGVYRGAYVRRGVGVAVGAAAVGAAAASAYNYNYGYSPTYYGDTGYYQQQPYGYYQQPYGYYSPYRNWRQF